MQRTHNKTWHSILTETSASCVELRELVILYAYNGIRNCEKANYSVNVQLAIILKCVLASL
jgi:hypothetical protein